MEAANEMALVPIEKRALAEFDITPQAVAERVAEFADLHVVPGDSKSYKQVKSAYMVLVHLRNDVDKRRKKLGEDAREWINATGKAAKELIAPTTPLEGRFKAELDAEDARIEAEKAEKVRIERERVEGIRAKIEAYRFLAKVDPHMNSESVRSILAALDKEVVPEDVFQEFTQEALLMLAKLRASVEDCLIARIKWEDEQAAAKIEAERLEKQRQEQAAERKRLEAIQEEADENARMEREILHAERRKIEAEKKALEDAKRAEKERQERAAFEARAREEAKARAEAEAKANVEREAREAAERAEKERIEKERQDALAPDKEKLRNWAKSLLDMSGPILSDDASRLIASNALSMIREAGRNIFAETEAL